jgi:GNAT superfamily N-acetyltransferase
MAEHEITDVTPDDLGRLDLFCKKSKPKEPGYSKKVSWFEERYAEGLRLKLLRVDEGKRDLVSRGFIEYVPAERGWRVVKAPGYALVHCLWVVGRNKKKGYGSELLGTCVEDAEASGMRGVAVVAGRGNWLTDPKFFTDRGFRRVDAAPPGFELLALKFAEAPDPSFPTDWEARLARFGKGLVVVRTPQCPYAHDATEIVRDAAGELGMEVRVVELATPEEVQERAPSAYGVFNIVYGGRLVSYCWLSRNEAPRVLAEFIGTKANG